VLSGWAHHDAGQEQVAVLEFERAARFLRQICASDPDDFLALLELASRGGALCQVARFAGSI
jgi:hypothetical protein